MSYFGFRAALACAALAGCGVAAAYGQSPPDFDKRHEQGAYRATRDADQDELIARALDISDVLHAVADGTLSPSERERLLTPVRNFGRGMFNVGER